MSPAENLLQTTPGSAGRIGFALYITVALGKVALSSLDFWTLQPEAPTRTLLGELPTKRILLGSRTRFKSGITNMFSRRSLSVFGHGPFIIS